MGKNNLIIGGSKGLGKEIYKKIPDKNLTVVLDKVDPNIEVPNFYKIDMVNIKEFKNITNILKNKHFEFDNIFITYGMHHTKPTHNIDENELKKIFEINFFSTINSLSILRNLCKKNCKIFYISSIAACTPIPYSSTYSSSKSALEAYIFSKINEYDEKNLRHIIIQPGNINTGFNETNNNYDLKDNVDYKFYLNIVSKIDSKFGMSPEKVARKIINISNKKNPNSKYVIGKNAVLANIAKRILGDNFSNKL